MLFQPEVDAERLGDDWLSAYGQTRWCKLATISVTAVERNASWSFLGC